MQTEIEVKFLQVDHDEIRTKLKALGAVCEKPMSLMRRAIFDYSNKQFQVGGRGQRLRVRDEGDKITITYKENGEDVYDHEIETTVGSYEDMVAILKAIGLENISYQESKREKWVYKDVEIVLDEWPWLSTYIEIEGRSEADVRDVSTLLNFDWITAIHGSVDGAYQLDYTKMTDDESIGNVQEVRFDAPIPEYLKSRK